MKYVKKLSEVPLCDAPAGEIPRSTSVMIDTGNSDELGMGHFVLPVGKRSDGDYHDQDEAYYVTRGRGYVVLWLQGRDREPEQYEIEPGTSVLIPKGVIHQIINAGEEDVWLVWFFPRHMTTKRRFSPETWVKREMPLDEWHPRTG